ncbi:hypothetical protein HKBW3S43_02049, partial [Candidatus Hakubella thermalkaliphila]
VVVICVMGGKAIRSGVSVGVSCGAPTPVALERAEARGCTVIGFLRGSRAKVYTNQWRVSAGRVTIVSGE